MYVCMYVCMYVYIATYISRYRRCGFPRPLITANFLDQWCAVPRLSSTGSWVRLPVLPHS